ncbi:sigma factor [Rhodococcus sp. HNM0569]|uniref:sigma factor n=1 Tax=Rhodococcus sp. HNM0569 TaxID=2716340 RepID=UPI001F0E9F8B|nr:sigma factor [Rhodococcus sp. HNM0569]
MDEQLLAAEFERQRPRLFAVAMRALGSRADADDAVQETWLRLTRYSGEPIENLAGWLTRVVGRICIDMLRSRTARAESMLDPWADGDPIVADDVEGTDDVVAAPTRSVSR